MHRVPPLCIHVLAYQYGCLLYLVGKVWTCSGGSGWTDYVRNLENLRKNASSGQLEEQNEGLRYNSFIDVCILQISWNGDDAIGQVILCLYVLDVYV